MKKGTYDIRKYQQYVQVTGWEFPVFGLGTFIVHRDVEYPNTWTVSEPRTGAFLTRQHKTRKAAIETASAWFHIERMMSQEKFEDRVRVLNRAPAFKDNPTTYYKEMMKENESRTEEG